jgi:SAM-dependent methyltransferase
MATDDSSLARIRGYWEAAAEVVTDNDGLRPGARDPFLQQVVETAMERFLWSQARLLDVGCGDGASTVRFAQRVTRAVGIDYIRAFVERAQAGAIAQGNVMFEEGDVLNLAPVYARHGSFDLVTTIRCLINLASWDNQAHALAEIAACLKPGGLYLASEGWAEGMVGLNLRRARVGLPAIKVVEYNTMIERTAFEAEASRYFEILDYIGIGLYVYISRIVQPLLMAPAPPRHDHPLNRVAAFLQSVAGKDDSFADCDFGGVYVLRRKT